MHTHLVVPTLFPSLVHVSTAPDPTYSISKFPFVMSLPCCLPFLVFCPGLSIRSLFRAFLIHTVALDTSVVVYSHSMHELKMTS